MNRERLLDSTAMLVGGSVAACGAFVICGWLLGIDAWIRPNPDSVPMQFNTALGFLILGVALASHAAGAAIATRAAAGLVLLLLAATAAQMLFKVNLGIDEAIVKAHVTTHTSQPGRMAPNTLLCLGLTAVALLLLTIRVRHGLSAAAVLASLASGVAMTALFGYSTSTEAAYAWGALTHMASPTALLLVVLGVGVIAAAWAPSARAGNLPIWLPFPAGAFALTITISAWSALGASDNASPLSATLLLVFGLCAAGTGPVALYLYVTLQRRTALMERMSIDRYRSLALTSAAVAWEAEPNGSFRPGAAWEGYTGQPSDSQGGSGWLDMVHEDDRMGVKSAWFDALLIGEPFHTQCRVWHAECDRYAHVSLRGAPVRDEDHVIEWIGTLTDEHEAVTASRELHESRGKYEQAFNMNPDAMFLMDMTNLRLIDVNASFNHVLGYTLEDFDPANERMPRLWADMEERSRFADELRTKDRVSEAPARMLHAKGHVIDTLMSAQMVLIDKERFLLCIVRDVTAETAAERERERLQQELTEANQRLEESNEKLQVLAILDPLTGVANRRAFDLRLADELRRAERSSEPLSLMMCDIDCFKQYNDYYGHVAGDSCLQAIAACIEHSFQRAGDLTARYGGEEFAVILPRMDADQAKAMGEKLLSVVRGKAIAHAGSPVADHVTLSVGVVTLTHTADWQPDEIVHCADRALYTAKETGRDRLAVTTAPEHTSADNVETLKHAAS